MALVASPACAVSRNGRGRGRLLIAVSRVLADLADTDPPGRAMARAQGASAAAHRKPASSRATATVTRLGGLPRSRRR